MRFLVLIVLLTACLNTSAADADGAYGIRGVGNIGCGKYVADYQENVIGYDKLVNDAWIAGFLTATNRHVKNNALDVGGKIDLESIRLWIFNYCNAHPLEDLHDATVKLVEELSRSLPRPSTEK